MSVGPIAPPPGGLGGQPLAGASGATPNFANPPSPVATQAAAVAALASPEAMLAALAGEAVLTQDSLAPLLADLAAAQDSPALPPAARAVIQQILTAQTPLAGDVTAQALRGAAQASGLFFEAALAAAVQGAAPPPDSAGDLKALLVQLLAGLDPTVESQLAALQGEPQPGSRSPSQARRAAERPAPPSRGGATAGQAAVRPNLELQAGGDLVPRILHQDAQAALSRLQLSQIASLPTVDGGARWTFELPVATPAGPAIAQFEISRDGAGPGATDGAPPTWRARFSLDAEPGGPVHAEISLSGGRTRVTLWAEREDARQILDADRGELQAALAGPQGGDAAVRVLAGAPPRPAETAPPAGRFLDRTS